MFCFFGWDTCGILSPGPGIKLTPPEMEVEVTGPPAKSLFLNIWIVLFNFSCCKQSYDKYPIFSSANLTNDFLYNKFLKVYLQVQRGKNLSEALGICC